MGSSKVQILSQASEKQRPLIGVSSCTERDTLARVNREVLDENERLAIANENKQLQEELGDAKETISCKLMLQGDCSFILC